MADPVPLHTPTMVAPEIIALAEAIGRALARRHHAEAEERARAEQHRALEQRQKSAPR